jgi:hypothetical protein
MGANYVRSINWSFLLDEGSLRFPCLGGCAP